MSGPIILPWRGVWPRIHASAFIAPGAVVIGDVEIGPDSSIWFGCVVRGDVHHIRIGARSNIQDGSVVHVTTGKHATIIGDDVLIGHNATLHGCTLESGSFVGMGAVVLDRAVVESGAMVAAAAMVPPGKRVPHGELWGGSPAKCLRALSAEEIANFPKACAAYAENAAEYRDMLAGMANDET